MSSWTRRIIVACLASMPFSLAVAQQDNSSIERARLFRSTPGFTNSAVNADGMALAADDGEGASDDSFGKQVILKNEQKVPTIFLSADSSIFYTDNVALTRRGQTGDAFWVTAAAASWTPRIAPQVEAQVGVRASIFRYNKTSALDFEDLGAGAGLTWSPPNVGGMVLIARYDFTELLNRHSDEILSDHQFSIGAQKTIQISRAQAFTTGLVGSAGLSRPHAAQRDQIGVFVGYHCALTRSIDADLTYRAAFYLYNQDGRADVNQAVSANLRYRFNESFEAGAFLTFADNRSNRSAFDYAAFTCGGGVGLRFRF